MVLSHGEGACTHTEANSLRAEVTTVATSTEDFTVGGVVLVGRVEGTATIGATEAPFVPDSVFADHLFCSEDGKTAPLATSLSRVFAWSAVGTGVVDYGGVSAS